MLRVLFGSRTPLQFHSPLASLRPVISSALLGHRVFTTHEIRKMYLEYFQAKGHRLVPGCPLIPPNDKSLLFTNSGMVQFKDYFLGKEIPPFSSAVSAQNCMRAGGKHNDLDNVGFTPRHHTFFEMLGNFSFGSYFKEEAISLAWTFLTEHLKMDPARLRVTVFETDEEAYAIWKSKIGLPAEKIIRLGMDDNFWSMGDGEGPCGRCTEIFFDTRSSDEANRWIEIWNLVFMENFRAADGSLSELKVKCVDTGMGLERVAAVLQGKTNTFDCDAFQSLTQAVVDQHRSHMQTGDAPVTQETPQVKIIADHFRAASFLIADGVVPSNTGRSYVLRRILRRAIRVGKDLGFQGPFLASLFPALMKSIDQNAKSRLQQKEDYVKKVITAEEVSFLTTLERGLKHFDEAGLKAQREASPGQVPVIKAEVAFQLFDTYGFPLDLTAIICRERNWAVDLQGAEVLMGEQRKRGKALSGKVTHPQGAQDWERERIIPTFVREKSPQGLIGTIRGIAPWEKRPNHYLVAVDPSPFYPRGGGQVGDSGKLRLEDGTECEVLDTVRPYDNRAALVVRADFADPDASPLVVGSSVQSFVNWRRRDKIEAHHSATHLLHAALRAVVGTHVTQAGSVVGEDRFQFDFAHHSPLTKEQLANVAAWMDQAIEEDVALVTKEMSKDEAISQGAMAMFGEKYGTTVRTVRISGYSLELCGGTHVDRIGKVYPFKILAEFSVGSGVRRIEATAGRAAVDLLLVSYATLERASKALKGTPADIEIRLEKLQEQLAETKTQADLYSSVLAGLEKLPSGHQLIHHTIPLPASATTPAATKVVLHKISPHWDDDFLQRRMNSLKRLPDEIHVLVSGKRLLCVIHDSSSTGLHAGRIVASLLAFLGGKGGGGKELGRGQLASNTDDQALIQAVTSWTETYFSPSSSVNKQAASR